MRHSLVPPRHNPAASRRRSRGSRGFPDKTISFPPLLQVRKGPSYSCRPRSYTSGPEESAASHHSAPPACTTDFMEDLAEHLTPLGTYLVVPYSLAAHCDLSGAFRALVLIVPLHDSRTTPANHLRIEGVGGSSTHQGKGTRDSDFASPFPCPCIQHRLCLSIIHVKPQLGLLRDKPLQEDFCIPITATDSQVHMQVSSRTYHDKWGSTWPTFPHE